MLSVMNNMPLGKHITAMSSSQQSRTETFTVATDGDYTHTRTIKKTPILKVVFDTCNIVTKKTDATCYDTCFSYEYNDDEIVISNAIAGDYTVYYESPTYTEVTSTMYNADDKPDWLKDDFVPIFWIYFAMLNTETKLTEMSELYKYYRDMITEYYSRTGDYEGAVMQPEITSNQ